MSLICLRNIDRARLKRIAAAFAESFLAQSGSLSSCMNQREAEIYFELTLYEYQRIGALYTLSDKEEGYIVYYKKDKGIRWYRDLYLSYRYFRDIPLETMQKMMLIRRGWTDYTLAHAYTKDYVDISLVSVRKEYQHQGYLRKLMAEPFAIADRENIPAILDTDAEHKAVRYEHIGMQIEHDEILRSGLHFYRMIYIPKKGGKNDET